MWTSHYVLCRSATDLIVTAEPKGAYGTTDKDFVVLTCACFVRQRTTRLRMGGSNGIGTQPAYAVYSLYNSKIEVSGTLFFCDIMIT